MLAAFHLANDPWRWNRPVYNYTEQVLVAVRQTCDEGSAVRLWMTQGTEASLMRWLGGVMSCSCSFPKPTREAREIAQQLQAQNAFPRE